MAACSPEHLAGGEVEGDRGQEDDAELRQVTDQSLREKIQRVQDALDCGIAARLSDGGAKLLCTLGSLGRELDRRKAAPLPPHRRVVDGRCERVVQSRGAESSGLVSGPTTNQVRKSDFHSAFGVDEKAGVDASNLERRSRSPDEPRTSMGNEGKTCGEKESPKPQLTKLSHKESCIDNSTKMEKISPDDDCKDNGHSRMSKHPSTLPCKRKKAASVGCSRQLRSRKALEVVLLDSDSRHSESTEETSNKRDAMTVYYPSREHPDSVELSCDDIKCLEPESCLSSPIMNFYIMYLQGPIPSISRPRDEYYIFNTYFYSKLEALTLKEDKSAYFLKLRRWWKGVDIFQKAYILLPVHADTHWSLVIICMPANEDQSGPVILHLDSLKYHSSKPILSAVESFLKEEWNYLNKNGPIAELPIQELVWKNLPRRIEKKSITVPQQENEYDCGFFVLYYMLRFIEEAPQRLHKKDLSMFGKEWFRPEEASALRKEMHTLLLGLFEDEKPKRSATEPIGPEHSLEES